MSLDNNSANNFKDFLDAIKPYLNYQPVDLSCMGIDAFQFSTDEKPVGMWTDRKILYQKVIDANIISQSSKKYIQHNIQNIGDYKRVVSVMFPISNNVYSPCRVSSNDAFQSLINDSEIEFAITSSWASNFTRAIVIVQYTKTTDSPLSSDEKFAGVTSGGEVIYERTIDYGSTVAIPNSGFTSIGMDASNISMILHAYGYHTDDARCCPLIAIKESNLVKCIAARAGAGMELRYFTIRYTKSS